MATIASDLFDFAARYGNKVLQEQVKMKAPLWDALEHLKMTGAVGIVNPIAAGAVGATFIADGGARSTGSSNTPVQGTVGPRFLDCPLVLNKGTLMTLTGREDSANYLDSQLKQAGSTLAQAIGSSMYATTGLITSIASVTNQFGAVTAGQADVVVSGVAGLKEGMSVTLVDDSADRAFVVRVAGVTFSGSDLTATVKLVNDVPGVAATGNNTDAALAAITFAAGDDIFQRGTLTNEGINAAAAASDLGPISLSDICGSGTLYGISAANAALTGWVGNSFTGVGVPSQESILLRMKRVHQKSGEMPDLIAVSPIVSALVGISAVTAVTAGGFGTNQSGQARRAVDGKLDKYGREFLSDSGIQIAGKRVLEDVNCGDTEVYLINTEFLKVAMWQEIEATKQGGDTLLVDQTNFAYKAYFSAAFNLYTNKRSAHAKLAVDAAF